MLCAVAALAALSCATLQEALQLVPEAGEVESTLLLVGDAGEPNTRGEPVLQALSRDAALAPQRTTVVFLGDNVYPRGLPAEGRPGRQRAERILDAQVAVCASGCRVVFVPGNHDWDKGSAAGWDAVRRQGAYLEKHGSRLVPADGAPGPVVEDVGPALRIVFLDTHWWLHSYQKPQARQEDVLEALRRATESAEKRQVVVLAHHPLFTSGIHAANFSWRQHIFPLQELASWLLLPLPGLGSAYPLSRKLGVSSQDVTSGTYRHLLESVGRALKDKPPLLWAGGHEHNIQVHRGPPARYQLVSGGGIYGHTTPLHGKRLPTTLYRTSRAGFARLDVLSDGRARLSIRLVEQSGDYKETFSTWLD